MVIDYKLFTPGSPLLPNTFVVGEQAPGLFVWADKTDVCSLHFASSHEQILSLGYWPSFNIPFFPEMYNYLGYPSMCMLLVVFASHSFFAVQRLGNEYSHSMCARAQLFRRNHCSVHELADMQAVMQQNDYLQDPLSHGNPAFAISARYDLASGTLVHVSMCAACNIAVAQTIWRN